MSKTAGAFDTEDEAAHALDDVLRLSEAFHVYHEVPGYYMAHRPDRQLKTPRIDRILVPTAKLRDAGWNATIGVEIKQSGAKCGPTICQALDYTWAVFRCGSTYLYPEWVFIWPMETQLGDIQSVMTQNRIGVVSQGREDTIRFWCGGTSVIGVSPRGVEYVKQTNGPGRKVGSR